MPRLSSSFLSPLVRRHAVSQFSGHWGYIVLRSSSSSSAQVEAFSFHPKLTTTTRRSSTAVADSSVISRASPLVETNEVPQVIPKILPDRRRTLVLCFDGTNEQLDDDISNIVRFFKLLKKDNPSEQLVYYQAGVGTTVDPKKGKPWIPSLNKLIDAAIATGLGRHVRGGYEFLMQNYTEGDKIAIFGFSRGAYTARALAGMLQKVGLLPVYNNALVSNAYDVYKRDDSYGREMSKEFKQTFSVDVHVDFMGVFDTVSRVGISPRKLPFSKTSTHIRVFRHALALDERRADFKVSLWGQGTGQEGKLGERSAIGKLWRYIKKPWSYIIELRRYITEEDLTEDSKHVEKNREPKPRTSEGHKYEPDVKEVWFAGAHSDVGGGSVPNNTANYLARIPLHWMIRECFNKETGILFHSAELEDIGLSPDTLWPVVKTPIFSVKDLAGNDGQKVSKNTATETLPTNLAGSMQNSFLVLSQSEEDRDALSKIYDRLLSSDWWMLMELLPRCRRQDWRDESWRGCLSKLFSYAMPRVIQEQMPYVHRSVQYRMEKLGYTPRAKLLSKLGPRWVD